MNIDSLVLDFKQAAEKASCQNLFVEEWAKALAVEFSLAEELRFLLLRDPFVTTDNPAVKEILSKIDLAECRDSYQKGMELLFDVIRPEQYLASLAEIDLLLLPTGTEIPQTLRSFVEEARRCYALGQFSAVQCLCRTILEATVNEIGVLSLEWTKKQLHTRSFSRAYPFKDRVKLVAGNASDKICDLYTDLCSVVHGENTSATNAASKSLILTIHFVQHLYTLHRDHS